MEVFNLNIIPGAVAPIIHASQYDEDREFRANLFEGDQVFELSGAETISVNVRKPDGNVVTAAVVNTGSNYVEFSTTLQMTACAGASLCQLRIENSPRKIGSLNFILAVERDPLEGGIQSASEIHNLETQVAGMVAQEVAGQYDSANVIFDNTPTAGHGVGYAVTSEGVKTELDTLSTAIAGKVDQADFDANNLPIESGSATNTKDYIDSRSLGDLSNVVLTSPQASQMLQFANVGGQLKLVNTSRNAIRHTTVSGTTDGTGDILCSDLPLANYQILSAYKNRTISGQSAVGYCILGGNNQTHPYIHVIKTDNTSLASTAVTIEVYYVEI